MKNKIKSILIISAIVLAIAVFVMADTQEELEAEKLQLEQELTDANSSWLVNYSGNVSGVFYENYTCNETGYETSKVITEGVHDLEFDFGGIKAYAHNLATAGGFTATTHTTFDDFTSGTFTNGTYVNGTTATDSDGNIKMVVPGEPSDKDASMVLWMHMNNDSSVGENDTHVYDFSGNGNNGSVVGATYNTSGKFGGAFEFDGDGGYVNGSLISVNEPLTISAWIFKSDYYGTNNNVVWIGSTIVNYRAIMVGDYDFHLHERALEGVLTTTGEGDILTNGQWYHVVGVWESDSIRRGYLNGVEIFSNSSATYSVNPATIYEIGHHQNYDWDFNGSIDEVAIYNRSLSASEIHALYLSGNATRANITESNWTSPVLDAGQTGVNWTTIEWDAVQDSRANVSRTSELDYNEDMVLWMHFNNDSSVGENDTHVYDWSGSGNNGTVHLNGTGKVNMTGGKFAGAIEFDGEGDYVDIIGEGSKFSTNVFTVSAWIYPSSTNTFIIDNRDSDNDGWTFHLTNNIACYYLSSDAIGATTITLGTWSHVVCRANSSNVTVYLNGVEDGSVAQSGTIDETTDMRIGARSFTSPASEFNGLIDEVAIWNRSLSAEEIRNLYYEDVVKFQTRTATTSAGVDSAEWSDYLRIDGSEQSLGLCVAENSLILMADGTRKKITEIKEGDMVMSVKGGKEKLEVGSWKLEEGRIELRTENLELVASKVLKLFDMGYKPIYELKTESGKAINTTGNHPYLVKVDSGDGFWDWILGKLKW